MSIIRRLYALLTGKIYIPDEARDLSGKTLLHISDTPHMIYGDIKRLIETLQPDYIIHTGDMVDNVKLGLYPFRLADYRKSLKKLGHVIHSSTDAQLFIAAGNHDHVDTIKGIFPGAQVSLTPTTLEIEGHAFRVSHYAPVDPSNDDNFALSLFGHDLSMHTQVLNKTSYLNGIEHISIIELSTLKIIQIEYPAGTNDSRLRRNKIGM